jgi:ketosteroid isomerase-like protein
MSQENVEATRRIWERFLAGDIPGMLVFLDPDVEIHDAPGFPDGAVYRGHKGYLAQIERFGEAFRDITWEPGASVEYGDRVLSVIHATGVGRASGIKGAASFIELLTWREGKVVRVDYFRNENEALEAAGLRE